jgi:hypothetical protein
MAVPQYLLKRNVKDFDRMARRNEIILAANKGYEPKNYSLQLLVDKYISQVRSLRRGIRRD